jgi:CubicO group peptidase (beta-lactamase class C family)
MRYLPIAAFAGLLNAMTFAEELYYPAPGETIQQQSRWTPAQAGLNPRVIEELTRANVAQRWALWRYGRLIHVQGDFNEASDVASNRKTWHAMLVGAAIKQRKIPSIDEKLSRWNPELSVKDAAASWRHVITQSAGFDYPYANFPDFEPGQMWTYSDLNLVNLCRALARVYGKKDYTDSYDEVLRAGYFDAIGMRGWRTVVKKDAKFSGPNDGVRLLLDLEDMGGWVCSRCRGAHGPANSLCLSGSSRRWKASRRGACA